MADHAQFCFHCGEPCPKATRITVEHNGQRQPMCCYGCKAVFEVIVHSGLDRYYQFRTSDSRRADPDLDKLAEAWQACDTREELWGEATKDGRRDLLLQTEGVRCAACAWLIRRRLEPQPGIERVQVDVGSGYTRILWDPAKTRLSHMALELARIGYRPHLPLGEEEERARLQERRGAMLRVGVAGLGMMQVMMYAVGLYAGESLGITAGARRFLEWTSLLVSVPVVLYSARPFFTAALAVLNVRRLSMDVPVALAIAVAFIASCVNFLRGQGDVYFDSVVMFVFFLSAARYVQLVQRHRNLQGGAALACLLPEWALRVGKRQEQTVLATDLVPGDRVRVRRGEPFPADGLLLGGDTEVDESLLTGESMAVTRRPGDAVVGGSINCGQPVEMQVRAVGQDLTVSALGRMLLRAGSRTSRFVTLSERVAAYFVAAVLLIAVATGAGWMLLQPSGALSAVLAVLVVSCPCALSLAAPASLAAAGRRLLGEGVLMTRGDALEALVEVDVAVFDKTGTLTRGAPVIRDIHLNPDIRSFDQSQICAIAAALEMHSAHPLARAFGGVAPAPGLGEVEVLDNRGVSGTLDGLRWSIGSAAFVGMDVESQEDGATSVWLTNEDDWVARFEISDEMRPGAAETLAVLTGRGVRVVIASGDAGDVVKCIAKRLGVAQWHARQSPPMKMQRVQEWQERGQRVLMVGDGVNDAPVLAAADVSMTVTGAADLANSAADFILTGESLEGVTGVMDVARKARRVVRQNLSWAILYNAAALPLAVSGFLEPWMAALGMSLSSLLVVANSARLARTPTDGPRQPVAVAGAAPA